MILWLKLQTGTTATVMIYMHLCAIDTYIFVTLKPEPNTRKEYISFIRPLGYFKKDFMSSTFKIMRIT